MDPKALAKDITTGVMEKMPAMVETLVKENVKDTEQKVDAVANDVKEMKENVEELAKVAKFAGKTEREANLETAKNVFGTYLKTLKRTKNHQAAIKATIDIGYKATMNEGTDAEGGFLVPEEFNKTIFQRLDKVGVARANATVLPMATDTMLLNKVASGVTVGWVNEATAYSSSEPTFERDTLVAKKVGAIISATLELIDDNMANETIWNIAITQVTNALMLFEDTQVLTGDGTGSNMQGVLTHTGVNIITLPATKTGFADFTYQDLLDMIYSIEEKDITSEGNLKFYGHRSILGKIRGLLDANNRPILEYIGTGPSQSALVLGYEFITTPVMPGFASSAVDTEYLIFGDLSAFFMGDRQQITMDFGYKTGDREKDIQSLKVRERIDGELVFPASLSVLKTAAA